MGRAVAVSSEGMQVILIDDSDIDNKVNTKLLEVGPSDLGHCGVHRSVAGVRPRGKRGGNVDGAQVDHA